MALNYRYDKKGKVTGVGWGKGKNYEAGAKLQRANLESQQKEVRRLDKEAAERKAARAKKKSAGKNADEIARLRKKIKRGGMSMKRGQQRRRLELQIKKLGG